MEPQLFAKSLEMSVDLYLTVVLFSVSKDHIPLSRPCSEEDCSNGCICTNMLNLPYNRTVQLVLINYNPQIGNYNFPVHMHGHSFSVMRVGYPEVNVTTGRWMRRNDDVECDDKNCAHAHWRDGVLPILNQRDPPIRDVVNVPVNGYVVIRFRTLNPGFWLMHWDAQVHAQEGRDRFKVFFHAILIKIDIR